MSAGWSQSGFETIAQLVLARTGIGFEARGADEIERATRHAMEKAGVGHVDEFARRLARDDGGWAELIEEITVRETYLYRNPEHFELLRQRVLPALRASRPEGHRLRVWSAGCASGEEAYSLAILLDQQGLLDSALVRGSDLCEPALAKARAGRYRDWSLRGLDRGLRERYLRKDGEEYVISEALRNKVSFIQQNLVDDSYPSLQDGIYDMDLILCRNVLIYFGAKTIQRVECGLFDSLAAGGFLLIGPSDPVMGKHAPFHVITTECGLLYYKPLPGEALASGRGFRGSERPQAGAGRRAESTAARGSWPAVPPQTGAHAGRAGTARASAAGADEDPRAHGDPAPAEPVGEVAERIRKAWRAGGAAAGLQACHAGLSLHPLSPELHYLKSLLLLDLGRHAEAARAVRHCLYLDRSLLIAHFTLATLLERLHDPQAARRAYRNLLEQCSAHAADEAVPLGDGVNVDNLTRAASRALAALGAS